MSSSVFYPRSVERRLVEALDDSPIVLYEGETGIPFGDRFHAVPIPRLWKMP